MRWWIGEEVEYQSFGVSVGLRGPSCQGEGLLLGLLNVTEVRKWVVNAVVVEAS